MSSPRRNLDDFNECLPGLDGSSDEQCSDLANITRLYELADGRLIYVENHGWFKWDERTWTRDDLEAVRIAAKIGRAVSIEASKRSSLAACEDRKSVRTGLEKEAETLTRWARISESRPRIEAAVELAKPSLAVAVDKLDANINLFAANNCTINLETFIGLAPRKSDLITKCSPVNYSPNAKCPLWEKTLAEVFAHDPLLIPYIQRVAGYCLGGSTKEQVMFFCFGAGANGKNTLIGTLQRIWGPYAIQGSRNLLMTSRTEKHSTEVYDLRGVRMTVVSETAESRRLDESLVKSLTGDDFIRARKMRMDNEEFRPTHKLFLLTNHKPVIEGTDYAIWRRIHLIPFTQTFGPDKRDPDLQDKLITELPGILNWCVQGCREWRRIGLKPPDSVVEATRRYRGEMDAFEQFLDERCELKRTNQVNAAAMLKAYKSWCLDAGEEPKSRNWIWERLEEREITKCRTSRGFNYYGIGLIGNVDDVDHEHFSG